MGKASNRTKAIPAPLEMVKDSIIVSSLSVGSVLCTISSVSPDSHETRRGGNGID